MPSDEIFDPLLSFIQCVCDDAQEEEIFIFFAVFLRIVS